MNFQYVDEALHLFLCFLCKTIMAPLFEPLSIDNEWIRATIALTIASQMGT